MSAAPREILDFWFSDDDRPRTAWFQSRTEFDQAIRQLFLAETEAALAGELDGWRDSVEGCLALCLLLDQFPRNLFRGTPRAFAGDERARDLALHVLDKGFDQLVGPVRRVFFYLPFEHSEALADQDRSVALFESIAEGPEDSFLDYARRHRDIILRFGRFPHRNAILGRDSTPEEAAFLAQPNSSF